MRSRILFIPLTLLIFLYGQSQTTFTGGNILVYRVGDGSVTLTGAAAPVFIDEYTSAGVLVQSIALPVAASGSNHMLTAAGIGTTEGVLTSSGDGQYVVFTGYNTAVGTLSVGGSSSVTRPRVLGLVKYDGTINTSTSITDLSSGGPVRSAVSSNGTDLWACGAGGSGGTGGIRYATLGAGTSTQVYGSGGPTQLRCVCIHDGQLYVAGNGGTPRLGSVGAGLPITTGQIVTNLPGLLANIDPGKVVFLDMDASVAGADVLYYTDESDGIIKYSLVSGNWVSNGIVGTADDDYRGIAVYTAGSTATIYATRRGSNSTTIEGGQLVKITDASGYNGSFSATPVVLAISVTDRTAFRGVANVPLQSVLPIKLVTFTAEKLNKDVKMNWVATSAVNFSHFEVERSLDGMIFDKVSHVPLHSTGNMEEKYSYTDAAILDVTLQQSALYYRLKMVDADGHTEYSKIVTIPLREKTNNSITVYPDPFINQIFVNGVQPGHINASLVDMHGKIVKSLKLILRTGEQTITLSGLEILQKGTYILRIRTNNKTTSFKLFK
jgi:hypothetical protein